MSFWLGCWIRKPGVGARSFKFGSCKYHVCRTIQVSSLQNLFSAFFILRLLIHNVFLIICHKVIFQYCGFFHVISKLGVPIKTTVSATVLEEALNGVVSIRPLSLGQPLCRKVWFPSIHTWPSFLLAWSIESFLLLWTGWKAMCPLLFGYTNRKRSRGRACLQSIFIR